MYSMFFKCFTRIHKDAKMFFDVNLILLEHKHQLLLNSQFRIVQT